MRKGSLKEAGGKKENGRSLFKKFDFRLFKLEKLILVLFLWEYVLSIPL